LCKTLSNIIGQFTSLMMIEILHDHLHCIEKLDQCHPDILFINPKDSTMNYKDFLLLINKPPFIIGLIQDHHDKTEIMNYLDDGIFDLLFIEKLSLNYFCKKMSKIKYFIRTLEEKKDKYFVDDYNDLLKYTAKKKPESVFIKQGKTSVRVKFEEILYIRNMGSALVLYLTNNRILHHRSTLKKIVTQLPTDFFIRINNATVVNFKKIDVFEKNAVSIQNKNFHVTRIYLEHLKSKLEKL